MIGQLGGVGLALSNLIGLRSVAQYGVANEVLHSLQEYLVKGEIPSDFLTSNNKISMYRGLIEFNNRCD